MPSGGRERPEWPRRLGPPTPFSRRHLPRMTSPVAFPNKPAPARLTPVFPPHPPRTGVRRPAARPTYRPNYPLEAPLAIPSGSSRVARGGLEGPGREVAEACGGLSAAARTRCQEAQERDGAGGVAESMDGPLVEGALAVGVHGTPLFSHPRGWGQGAHEGIGALDVPLVDPGKVQVGQGLLTVFP